MAYLGVPHLAIWEANFFIGSDEGSGLVLLQEAVEEGLSGKSNRTCFIIRADTNSIEDNKQYFLEWLIQGSFSVACTDFLERWLKTHSP